MKHIKQDFSLKAWIQPLWVDLWGGAKPILYFLLEYGHVAYPIETDDACSNMVENILPTENT